MRNIQSGERVLLPGSIERVLSERNSIATASGTEDFAHVIEVAAVGVTRTHCKLFEQVISAEFGLHTVVIGEAAIVAREHNARIAVDTAQCRVKRLSWPE